MFAELDQAVPIFVRDRVFDGRNLDNLAAALNSITCSEVQNSGLMVRIRATLPT